MKTHVNSGFGNYHPLVNFYYFFIVITFSMFFMHPVFLGIALIMSFIYSIRLNGSKAVKFNILYMIPLLIFSAFINVAFNHAGVTMLFYLKGGNPITLESIVYGFAAGAMFVAVILWFSCYNAIMTSDKFIYLFGRIIPGLSLILSMVLRFVPRYKAQIKRITRGQRAVGRDMGRGNIIVRARNGLKILSIMTTWALENAIETADSMKARGYGLPGRSSFSIFKFEKRDKVTLISMAILTGIILVGAIVGENTIAYFPAIKIKPISIVSIVVYLSYILLASIPIIIDYQEVRVWEKLQSKI